MPDRRLFLDTVPDDFDPKNDLALSPSCFVGREHIWPDWDLSPFEDPLTDPDRQWRDWVGTRILANRLCRGLSTELNRVHGTDYGYRYWRELTILWLLLLIQSAWLRYLQIDRAIEKWGQEPFVVPVSGQVGEWVFSDDLDFFHNGPKNKDYELWVATLILKSRAPEKWRLTLDRDVSYQSSESQYDTIAAKSAGRKLVERIVPRRAVFNLTGAGRTEWFLSALVPFLPKRPQILPATIDEVCESEYAEIFPDEFLDIVNILIERTKPKTLGEDFEKFDRQAAELSYRSGRVFVSGGSKYVVPTRFQTAHALESGERVYRYQHGAFYGLAHIMIGHEIEFYDHGFVSWGWREDSRVAKPAVALPAPQLARMRDKRSRTNDDIIFVGTNMELGPYPFKPSPQQSRVLEYRRRKIRFINSLPAPCRENLKYRQYVNAESDISDLEFVEKFTGPIPEIIGPLNPPLFSCAIAVIDHPSSVMYHSFAANIPTLLTWDRKAWPEHQRGTEQYDLLADAGILVESPEEAAEKIDRISNDIDRWWRSGEVQATRLKWCDGNAIFEKNWFVRWVRALATIS